jgi:hypothetical protein
MIGKNLMYVKKAARGMHAGFVDSLIDEDPFYRVKLKNKLSPAQRLLRNAREKRRA